MKICFLITGLGIGGAEKHLLNIVPKIKFEKFIISLTNNRDLGKEIEKKGIKVYYLGLNTLNLPLIIFKFKKILKFEKPDVLDTYLIHSNLFGRIFGRLFGVKRIISSIRSDYTDFRLGKLFERITKRLVTLYILNSHALMGYLHKSNRVPINKIKILPNGIDFNEIQKKLDYTYNVRDELKLKKESLIVVFTGRLIKDKNIEILINAMKILDKKIHLILVGDGPERDDLVCLSNKLKIEKNIHFLGKRYDVYNIINSSDIFILPSKREGMSNALLEAMALKKKCIVSNIPQNKELIQDGINGFTFNPDSISELVLRIKNMYDINDYSDFGANCFDVIKKKFNINIIIDKYEKIIKETFF